MKNREKCSDFSRRHSYIKHAWCALLAVSLLMADGALCAEEGSRLPENTHSAPNGSTLPANTVASSANTSVPASTNGSGSSLTGITVQDAEANSPSAVGTQAVASNTTSSVGTSASNTASPFQASVLPTKTAPTGTSNSVPSSTSATVPSTTGTSGATASGVTTVPATNSGVTAATGVTASTATGATATDAMGSSIPSGSINTTISTATPATGSASTPSSTANSSQTPPAPANIPLGGTTALAGTNGNPSAPEEEEPQDLGDILDLRPPAKLKVSLLPWVIALLVVLSAVGLWFLLKRKRHGKAKKEKPTKSIDPYEAVLQALKEASKKLDVTNPKPFAFFLTDAVRLYLSRVFRLPAPECTTQELLQQLPWCTELTDDLRTNITQFLQRCDLVKFTTMPFDEPFLLQLHQQAESIVAASHELTKPKPAPAASAATGVASSSKPEKTPKK